VATYLRQINVWIRWCGERDGRDNVAVAKWQKPMRKEREVLTLHSDAQSGSYAVKMGWYNPKSGVRVPVVAGGTEVRAGTLQVVAAASPRSARRAVP